MTLSMMPFPLTVASVVNLRPSARLHMWKESLSEELQITTSRSRQTATPHKLMLHLAYWWLVILLHRPFFHRKSRPIHSTDSEIDHVKVSSIFLTCKKLTQSFLLKICRQAAEQIMELLSTWRTLYKIRYCPVTLIQTAFSAGTVYLLIAMQASSGTRIARKEVRHSLDQEALVRQYLQEIGLSWNCATHISVNLRKLMDEQVRPHLDLMDRKNIPTTLSLQISADIGEEETNSSRSRSSSRKRSSITKWALPIPHPQTMSSGSGHSSLSTSPTNHILNSKFPTLVPPPANPSISSTITVSSAYDTSPTHTAPSAPIAIQSLRTTSSNPSSFTDSWAFQPSPGSSPNVNYLPSSSAQPDFRKYAQSFMEDPFSGNGNRSSDDLEHGFGDLVSFLAHNFQRSQSSEYLGMLDGQTLSETPFVGYLGGVEDTHSPNFENFGKAPFGTGFPNHESSSTSFGEHVSPSSHGGNDNMDLDSVPWMPSFTS